MKAIDHDGMVQKRGPTSKGQSVITYIIDIIITFIMVTKNNRNAYLNYLFGEQLPYTFKFYLLVYDIMVNRLLEPNAKSSPHIP